jgi:hypothetical protein
MKNYRNINTGEIISLQSYNKLSDQDKSYGSNYAAYYIATNKPVTHHVYLDDLLNIRIELIDI